LDKEFEKYFAAGKSLENIDGEELMRNVANTNVIPQEDLKSL
jgi:hypothetical protein